MLNSRKIKKNIIILYPPALKKWYVMIFKEKYFFYEIQVNNEDTHTL